jgi:RNA polymerase sigma factor (sigma-70 family)
VQEAVQGAAVSSVAQTTGEAQLYERHSDAVLRYCLRMLGSREDAEDAAQTTFFQAVRAMRRGVVPTFEQAWLLTIAKNECRSRHRANGRRRRLELVRDPQTLAEVAEAPNGSDGTLIGVQQALSRLPETQRRALLLREWQGRSYEEIAHELGTTLPAVEALLFRARRALARELDGETKKRRHAFDVASLLAAVKSALGGGAAVKIAAGIVAVATVGTVAGGAEERPARAPAPPTTVRVQPAVGEPRPTATQVESTARRRAAADRRGSSRRIQTPTGAPGDRAAIRRAEEPEPAPAAGAPTSPQAPAAGTPDKPTAPEQAAAGPVSPPSTPIQTPAPPPAPSLSEIPGVSELPKVEAPQLPQVPELPQVPQLPDVPDVPDAPAVPDLPVLP